jgi:hypothetical protein
LPPNNGMQQTPLDSDPSVMDDFRTWLTNYSFGTGTYSAYSLRFRQVIRITTRQPTSAFHNQSPRLQIIELALTSSCKKREVTLQ